MDGLRKAYGYTPWDSRVWMFLLNPGERVSIECMTVFVTLYSTNHILSSSIRSLTRDPSSFQLNCF